MSRSLLLDLFCCAGGASKGYHDVGFDVIGVDLDPQPNYPFEFIQSDALWVLQCLWQGDSVAGYLTEDFVGVHASPPCQGDSVMSKSWNGKAAAWPKLIAPTRDLLVKLGLPYVIENVVGADLVNPVRLCGSMFDLPIERHRKFEASFLIPQPACNHARQRMLWPEGFPALRSDRSKPARVVGIYGTGGGDAKDFDRWKWAMDIEWMKTKHELAESIPPAYTRFVGEHLQNAIRSGLPAMIDTNDFRGGAQ